MRRLRLLLWSAVAIAAVLGAGFYFFRRAPAPTAAMTTTSVANIGGPFTLTDSDGQPYSSSRLAGRPFAIFFGFTHCPDVCPTTLARMTRLRKALGKGDEAFSLVFVSVDPERDTPAEMGRYSTLFGSAVIGLTGSPAAIERVKKQYGIYSKKVAQPGGNYTIDHSATVLLFDRVGNFRATIATDEGDTAALDKLKALIA